MEVALAVIDIIFVFQDWVFDLMVLALFAEDGHVNWAVAAGLIITLPGLAIMIGSTFEDTAPGGFSKYFWRFITVVAYPMTIVRKGREVISKGGQDLIRLRHMKSYDGLLQSSFMFFMQIVVLFTRPSVGTQWGISDGKLWILVLGMFSSLLNMLWDITLYHVVSDGEEQNIKKQSKLLPYYLVHFFFRSFALATFFIYWKHLACVIVLLMVLFNMWLTWHTYTKHADEAQPHIKFCTVVGGKQARLQSVYF